MSNTHRILWLGGLSLFVPLLAAAQAPPGPITPPPDRISQPSDQPPTPKAAPATPRKNIMGAWKLNKDESDSPPERGSQDGSNNGGSQRGGGVGGPRIGIGGPIGGGGYGGRRNSEESDADRERMREIYHPARQITLSTARENAPEIDLTDDHDRKRAFFTDGRKLQKPKDDGYEEIAAHWDDNRLTTDEKGPRGGKISRTYMLSPDGTQLFEEVRVTSSGKNGYSSTTRFVYDQVNDAKAADASAPKS